MKLNLIFSILVLLGFRSYACEPCPEKIKGLAEMAKMAPIVAIVERDDAFWFFNDNNWEWFRPSRIRLRVIEVLKGDIPKDKIYANSWAGMCSYGLVLHTERALVFLKPPPQGNSNQTYQVADEICGENQYIVDNGEIFKRGKPIEKVKSFIQSLE